jgi:hypothetical protein
LWKNPTDLNGRQRQQLDWIAKTDPRLWRAYLLKEGLRYVFAAKGTEGKDALDRWLSWARRSQLGSFVHLAKRITQHRETIDAILEHGLSQGLIESTNTKIRLLTRIAFEFHGPQPLIALALLALGSRPPQLPGRNWPTHTAEERHMCRYVRVYTHRLSTVRGVRTMIGHGRTGGDERRVSAWLIRCRPAADLARQGRPGW